MTRQRQRTQRLCFDMDCITGPTCEGVLRLMACMPAVELELLAEAIEGARTNGLAEIGLQTLLDACAPEKERAIQEAIGK